jgi:hypothetical protein
MNHLYRLAAGLLLLAGAGCARGGDDLYDRTAEHFEWHLLNFYKQAQQAHETVDRYFFNRDVTDPTDHGLGVPK